MWIALIVFAFLCVGGMFASLVKEKVR